MLTLNAQRFLLNFNRELRKAMQLANKHMKYALICSLK